MALCKYRLQSPSIAAARHVRRTLLTCFLLGLLWAGVTGSSVLGVGEPTDLLLPVCTVGPGLAAWQEAGAPGDAFPLPCVPARRVNQIDSKSC